MGLLIEDRFRIRVPSAARLWPGQIWLTTGKYFHVGRLEAGVLRRIRGVQSQCHCTQIPKIKIEIY